MANLVEEPRPRSNSTSATRRKGRPSELRATELFDSRARSATISVRPMAHLTSWTGSTHGGSLRSLSNDVGEFFFGDAPVESAVEDELPQTESLSNVDNALDALSDLATKLEEARAKCDRAQAVATRANRGLGMQKFWTEVSSSSGALSATPSVSPASPFGRGPASPGRVTSSPPNSNTASPHAGEFEGTPPTSPNRGVTPSPDADLALSPSSLQAERVIRSMRAALRALESEVTDAERGSGVAAAETAEQERDRVLSQLQDIADGDLKEVAEELGAVRRVWIELFGDAEFNLEMLREKLREGSAEVVQLEAGLYDIVREYSSLRERLAMTMPEEDDAHDLEHAEIQADRREKEQLLLELAEGQKIIEETKQIMKATLQAQEAETRALADAKAQLAQLEAEEHELQVEVAEVTHALDETEQGLAQMVEQEEQLAHHIVELEDESTRSEAHLEQLTEVLASQEADLESQERARDALLESRNQAERDRRDESLARQAQHEALCRRESEILAEIMELSEMLSTVGEHKHGTREKRLELARELQAVLGERPSSTGDEPNLDDLITKVAAIKGLEYTEKLGGMVEEVEKLRTTLRELEASHSAHKQYIADNNLVLEHLDSRTAELEDEVYSSPETTAPSPTQSEEGCRSPTRQLIKTLKEHSDTPRKAQAPDVDHSVHMAVETEVEMSRLAKVVHQTSLAIRATVAKRNRLEEWSRANALRTWVPDASVHVCTACKDEFNFFNRRHHCRVCGKIFCADCSQMRVKIAKHWRDVRCCERCMDELEELAMDLSDELLPEAPEEPVMPRCVSSTCKFQTGSTCYSPACQRYLADSALDFEKHLRFEALLLEVKLKCGRAQNTSDELFFASIRMRVPESEWGDFLFQALTNGLN